MLIHWHSTVSFAGSCEKHQCCIYEKTRDWKGSWCPRTKINYFLQTLEQCRKKTGGEKFLLPQLYLRYYHLYRVFLAGLTSYFRDLNPKLHDRNQLGINIQRKHYILTGKLRVFTDDHERSEFHYFSQPWWFRFSWKLWSMHCYCSCLSESTAWKLSDNMRISVK